MSDLLSTAPQLHLVTDRRRLAPHARSLAGWVAALERQVEEAAACGVDVVQVRERDLEPRALVALTRALGQRLEHSSTRLVVNDRADVACAAAAGGVHLRGDGPPASRVRGLGAGRWRIGRSIHSVQDARAHQDADYLIFGTMFDSASKPGLVAAGASTLADVVAASRVSIIAIGGISAAGAGVCARAGAAGVAAIGIFLPPGHEPGALGVRAGAAALRNAFDAGRTSLVQ